MKYWLLVLGIFISATATAQLGFFVQGGANYSDLHITRGHGVQNGKGGLGGQIGGGVEYHTQYGYFLFVGANVAYESFEKDSAASGFPSVVSKYSYKPIFVALPFGIAYQFDLSKQVGLKVYGGLNVQIGAGGKLSYHSIHYAPDSVTGAPVKINETSNKHALTYGRNNNKSYTFDLANTNAAFTIGAGLNIDKSVELILSYQRGITNILPGNDAAEEINKLGLLQLNLKFYFPKHYYHTKKEKPYN